MRSNTTRKRWRNRWWKPKHQQAPECSGSFWNQPITRRFNQKQPITTPEVKGR